MMLSSQMLSERNNDPLPFVEQNGSRFVTKEAYYTGNPRSFAPRLEFHHGRLEANPILVDVRFHLADNPSSTPRSVVGDWERYTSDSDPKMWAEHISLEEINHAHRVLTLWLAVFA